MGYSQFSTAVIISAGGAVLDDRALRDIPGCDAIEADFVVADSACCVALRVSHECSREQLREWLGAWARARGWSLAVAPDPRSG